MTTAEFRDALREMGLTPRQRSYEGATIHQDRDGEFYSIPDPEVLTPKEREGFLVLLKGRTGL